MVWSTLHNNVILNILEIYWINTQRIYPLLTCGPWAMICMITKLCLKVLLQFIVLAFLFLFSHCNDMYDTTIEVYRKEKKMWYTKATSTWTRRNNMHCGLRKKAKCCPFMWSFLVVGVAGFHPFIFIMKILLRLLRDLLAGKHSQGKMACLGVPSQVMFPS